MQPTKDVLYVGLLIVLRWDVMKESPGPQKKMNIDHTSQR